MSEDNNNILRNEQAFARLWKLFCKCNDNYELWMIIRYLLGDEKWEDIEEYIKK